MVIVDDASTDNTFDIAEQLQKENIKKIVLIHHNENTGVGGAIADGYKWCRDNGIDIAAVMAGDAQMDPTELINLIQPVAANEADYAKGNRLIMGDAWKNIPHVRFVGNAILSIMTKISSGYWKISDSQCGYTVINKKALHTIDWDRMYKSYGQPNDLLVWLNIFSFRVVDVPVKPIYGIGEKSGIKPILIIPKLLVLLTKLFFLRMKEKYIIRDFHPLVFFYFTSFILFALNILLIFRFFIRWRNTGVVPEITALAILFCTSIGFQLLFSAMVFDENHK